MKQTANSLQKPIFSFFLLAFHITLLSHGFGAYTFVHMPDGSLEEIGMLCYRSRDKKLAVVSYDADAKILINAPIKQCGKSKTNRYMRLCFEANTTSAIVCTPTQEFYISKLHRWKAAYELKIGDELLCKKSIQKIAAIEYVKQPLDVYILEIKGTHTFFVGYHGVLTHNMGIPAAIGLGLSIPFGSATGAATAGSFFGPPAFIVGAVLGSALGAFVSMIQRDSIPSYKINFGNTRYIDNFIHQQSEGNNNTTTPQQDGNFISPMPNDPKKDDDKNKTARMPDLNNKQKLNHIFKLTPGHVAFSQAIYDAMDAMVKNASNYLGPDQFSKQWFSKILESGEQLWAVAQNGEVKSAGINAVPKLYNSITGLL